MNDSIFVTLSTFNSQHPSADLLLYKIEIEIRSAKSLRMINILNLKVSVKLFRVLLTPATYYLMKNCPGKIHSFIMSL